MRNMTGQKKIFHPGDRVAQIVITPHLFGDVVETDDLAETQRGKGGFGSTNTLDNRGTPHVDVQKYMKDRKTERYEE
jgi:hypothetical protein